MGDTLTMFSYSQLLTQIKARHVAKYSVCPNVF